MKKSKQVKTKLKVIGCKHKGTDLYIYPLCEGMELHLCENCHSALAPEVFKQLAVEQFSYARFDAMIRDQTDERLNRIEKITDKIMLGSIKNGK